MRIRRFAALGVAGLVGLGCADTSSSVPTDPGLDVRFAKPVVAACDAGLSRTAEGEVRSMLSGATLTQAQTNWNAVKTACSSTNKDAANSQLMTYVAHLRAQYPGNVAEPKNSSKEASFLSHLNTVFFYVGYDSPDLPAGSLDNGILAVIPATGGIREYQRRSLGAFKLPGQVSGADQRGHLFAMYVGGVGCLSVDNLTQVANCVQLNSFPEVFPKFDSAIKVGICVPEGLPAAGLVLGHETPGGTEVAGDEAYPDDCHVDIPAAPTTGLFRNLANRLASIWTSTVGVRTAYATDKGLGGIGSILSPWRGLKALIFAATFENDVVGQPPTKDNGDFDFEYHVTAPGSIVVSSGLGNMTGPLVVLSQGGGACANCGGLELRAKFFSASGQPADDGVYEINWTSVQSSPSVKGAPFMVSDGAGNPVATVSYATVSSQNILYYNGVNVGTWVRNESQNFKFIIDLNGTGNTRLFINGTEVSGPPRPFQPGSSKNIASFAADFDGIDSGVMGLDNIGVQRMSDQPSPNY
ncbi:MAG: hypothetical protein ACSLFK_11860 [Gemmatimonadaceae bacterium]